MKPMSPCQEGNSYHTQSFLARGIPVQGVDVSTQVRGRGEYALLSIVTSSLLPDKNGKRQYSLQAHRLIQAEGALVRTADDQRQRIEVACRKVRQAVVHEQASHALTLVCGQYCNLGEMSLPGRDFRYHDKANTLSSVAHERRRLGDERPAASLVEQVFQDDAAPLRRTIEHVELHVDCGMVR